jgi:hypothetical protein
MFNIPLASMKTFTLSNCRNILSSILIIVAIGIGLVATTQGQTRKHRKTMTAEAGSFTPPCSLPFKGVRHPDFDDRCGINGGSTDPAKQAESRAKNNFCAGGTPRTVTYKDLITLQKNSTNIPKNLVDRSVLKDLGNRHLGEGQYVSYIAFVENAHYSDVSAGEAVNCKIPGRTTNDIHIVLVQEPGADECSSTTAEISPHYRPAGWTDKKLMAAAAGHPVRFSGQLFFDGSHSPCTQNSRPKPNRASLWEIHPVYSIEICSETTISACQSGSASWTRLPES